MNRSKNILILGGTGFIGKNIFSFYEDFINSQGYVDEVNFYFLVNKNTHLFNSPNFSFIDGNFFDKERMCYIFNNYHFDEVWHFISSSVPKNSGNNIIVDIQKDLISTVHLLELMRLHKIKKIIYLSSGGSIYGESHIHEQFQEDFCNNSSSAYGCLKLCIENYIKLYGLSYQIDYRIYRLSNLFGKHHVNPNNGFINIAIRNALNDEDVTIWGNGTQSKDFIFASDFAKIFWEMERQNLPTGIYNIGSGEMKSLVSIINILKLHFPNIKLNFIDSANFDVNLVEFDISKLKYYITPFYIDFNKAIQDTIDFEREISNKSKLL